MPTSNCDWRLSIIWGKSQKCTVRVGEHISLCSGKPLWSRCGLTKLWNTELKGEIKVRPVPCSSPCGSTGIYKRATVGCRRGLVSHDDPADICWNHLQMIAVVLLILLFLFSLDTMVSLGSYRNKSAPEKATLRLNLSINVRVLLAQGCCLTTYRSQFYWICFNIPSPSSNSRHLNRCFSVRSVVIK